MIIVSIIGPTMRAALAQMRRSARFADLFELRLDLISCADTAGLLRATRKAIIATCRPTWEGGHFQGPERRRLEILKAAATMGADYVDVELKAGSAVVREFVEWTHGPKVIVSQHVFSGQKVDVQRLYAAMRATGAYVVKLAYSATDAFQILHAMHFLDLARADDCRAIGIAMGEYGEASRILYRKFGGWATYAAPENGVGAAPGQIPARELKGLYRADRLSTRTRVFGVLGNPLDQSKGIYLHNPLLRLASQDAVYGRFLVSNLKKFMKYIAPVLNGFSVTIPFKEKILEHLDDIDPTARGIGAVNTVIRRGTKLLGTNTDAAGALDAIERVTKVNGRRVLVLGAGGAARAIAYEAIHRGAKVLVANRTTSRASKLVRELIGAANDERARQISIKEVRGDEFDILVNATSVGMVPGTHVSPVPRTILRNKVVLDAVYNPPLTKLLKDAISMGARTISGTEMYLNQAALQFELYTGTAPDRRVMRRLLSRQLRS
jgi:3-dehydroquinate dehydratase/shikimate dehydrogenase